ncbi:MAG TPA: BTAD domain-containing putative transcriptional regulator [Acidimicrobiales bacterium]|nr:BTAD domain-containing putative transcriptional regulator [Acidimicrobiales bacterium]
MLRENGPEAMERTERLSRRPQAGRRLAALLVACVVISAALPAVAWAVDLEMSPNEVLGVDAFVGAQTEAPGDGRLRGYGFATTLTGVGTAQGADRGVSTLRPASGQRLVVFALRFDLLREANDARHPVHATVVVDGRRTALPDEDFVVSGERLYAASVPREARQVHFEMSAAGVAQTFSLTERRRIGDQPIVVYRDPAGPEVVSDLNAERTVEAANPQQRGAVSLLLKRVRLSWFSPDEPTTTPPSLDQAFLILEGSGDGVQPPYGSPEFGRYFSDFEALPTEAVKATLPDGSVLNARHSGSTKGLLGGGFYFAVPADVGTVRLAIGPATVRGVRYRGFVGEPPSRIRIEGPAEFEVSLPAGLSPATAAPQVPGTAATGRKEAEGRPPGRSSDRGRSLVAALLWTLAATLLGLGLFFGWRRWPKRLPTGQLAGEEASALAAQAPLPPHDNREDADDDEAEDEERRALVLSLTRSGWSRVEGAGALAAVRAAVVSVVSSARWENPPPSVIVLARGQTVHLLPTQAAIPPWLSVVHDEDDLLAQIEVAHLQRRRLAEEEDHEHAAERPPHPPWVFLVVPGPLEPAMWQRLENARSRAGTADYTVSLLCLGPGRLPWVRVERDGTSFTPGRAEPVEVRVLMMSEEEAVASLARIVPSAPLESAASAEPANAPPISVQLLGTYRILAGGDEVASGLRAMARELLAYLAVHRDGATADAAMEALRPGAPADKAQGHFRTVAANLRNVLRAAAELPKDAAVIERVGPRYRLDPSRVTVDLWQFEDALTAAAKGDDGAANSAADCYGGELAAGEDFVWAEPVREALRRRVVDHLTTLAQRKRAGGDLQGALRAMEQAIEADPYGEDLYRDVMLLQRELGRRDAVRRTYQLLETRLSEIGQKPNPETDALLDGH